MRKTFLFCFILSFVLISCNNADSAKKKIVETITTDFKAQNKSVYKKLDSIHIVSYDSLTEKKYLNFMYDRMAYRKKIDDTVVSATNEVIRALSDLGVPVDKETQADFNKLIFLCQKHIDSSRALGARMLTTADRCKVADSIQYYGFIVKATLYVTTAEVTSSPNDQIIIIDKSNK